MKLKAAPKESPKRDDYLHTHIFTAIVSTSPADQSTVAHFKGTPVQNHTPWDRRMVGERTSSFDDKSLFDSVHHTFPNVPYCQPRPLAINPHLIPFDSPNKTTSNISRNSCGSGSPSTLSLPTCPVAKAEAETHLRITRSKVLLRRSPNQTITMTTIVHTINLRLSGQRTLIATNVSSHHLR